MILFSFSVQNLVQTQQANKAHPTLCELRDMILGGSPYALKKVGKNM